MIYLNDHLWDFSLDEALGRLSDQRRQQVLRYTHELGRRTSAAAYLLLCEGLQREYGISVPPVFGYGEHGKPYIIGHADIHFNMSHCAEAAVCVLSNRPVGVDIETVRRRRDSLVAYCMNDQEQRQIAEAADADLEFTRLWTMKEAVQKLTGRGIVSDMRQVLCRCPYRLETVVADTGRYVYTVCNPL